MFIFYNLMLHLGLLVLAPFYAFKIMWAGKYRKSIGPKFGMIPNSIFAEMKGNPRIWIHAVSVGEVTAAAPIIKTLREQIPQACIILSTSTETGQEMARKIVFGVTSFIYFPLDLPLVVRKFLQNTKPDVFAAVETEIWPNFIREAKRSGTEVLIVNGRLSPRSFTGYFRTRWFWKSVLDMLGMIGAISDVDAERLKSIGVPGNKINVLGNAKFDSLAARANELLKSEIAEKLGIPPDARVFVAGSTHEGEEKIVLDVYSKLLRQAPDFLLIIIPRHIERGQPVARMVLDAGFPDCISMSEILAGKKRGSERVVIIDAIGELFKVYSLASFVFCGGSLVSRGGQNILEPAAWGKVVFYGPFMDDFQEEKALLEKAGSGIPVRSGEELLNWILLFLKDPEALSTRGEAGRRAIAAHKGSSKKYAEMIIAALKSRT